MHKKVMNFIHQHQLLQKNSTVLVAVSGGPDSTALLHFLTSIQEDWHLRVQAVSMDHQLRGAESKEDLQYVKALCKKWKIPLVKESIDVRQLKEKGSLSKQMAARKARYQFYKKQMASLKADYLALGHHGDDQVETMLMSFTRSTSVNALAGIPVKRPFAGGEMIRPFLCLTKKEILAYCKDHKIEPRFDPSNEDQTDLRVFFRKSVIPLIKEKNNNIHTIAQSLSESLHDDEHYLQKKAKEMVQSVVYFSSEKKQAEFKIQAFKKYPQSLQRRAYHLILNYLYRSLPTNLSYVHEEIFFSLFKRKEGNIAIDFPNELQIKKVYHKIVFSFTDVATDKISFKKPIQVPGAVKLPNQKILEAIEVKDRSEEGSYQFTFQEDEVALPLTVRTRKPGDRMSWRGLGGTKKVKDIFIDEKIPLEQRDQWPIVVDHKGKIIWLIGLRKASLRKSPSKGPYIKLIYKDDL